MDSIAVRVGLFEARGGGRAASLGKSTNKLIGDLTALSYLLSR